MKRLLDRAVIPVAVVEIVAALALLGHLPARGAWFWWSALSTIVVALAALVTNRMVKR